MPERTGTITEFITNPKENNKVFGLKLDSALKEDEYVYSFPDYRGEPFQEEVKRGDKVRLEYTDVERDGKTKHYISVLEIVEAGVEPEPSSGPSEARYEQRRTYDEMLRTSALAQAVAFHAQDATPSVDEVIKTAAVMEKYLEGGYERS